MDRGEASPAALPLPAPGWQQTDGTWLEEGSPHFMPSPVTTVTSSPQVSHTFSDYPPGVRHILFQHGGKDTQFWAGWYGPRVTNSSIVISPKTSRGLAPSRALPEAPQGAAS